MAELEAKGAEFEKAAEKKMRGWAFWGYKYDDAADLFEKAANSYKLGKFWEKAGSAYIKRADCHLKLESTHEAASAYVDAASCYKKISAQDALRCLILAVNHFMEIGRLSTAAKHNKDIGEIYEIEQDFEKAMEFFERAADLYQGEEINSTANQCRLKVAQFASQLELYPKAIEIFESVAKESINNSLLKYNVKGYLLNAGLCQICRGDIMTLNNALEKYQELDPTFLGTRECKFLADLVVSIDEEDMEKFTDVVKEFDSLSRLGVINTEENKCVGNLELPLKNSVVVRRPEDQWKTTLLLRAKNSLKAKELEEDDLT